MASETTDRKLKDIMLKVTEGKDRKINIAILIPRFFTYSGDGSVARLQAEDLAKEGNRVTIFAFLSNINKSQNYNISVMGAPRKDLLQKIYYLFPLDLIRWIPALKPFDLVIAHLYPMTLIASLAGLIHNVKYIFWYHGIADFRFFPRLSEKIYMILDRLLTRITILNADLAVSVSKFSRTELKKYTGRDSELVYNRADYKRFRQGLNGHKIRELHNLGNCPVLLSVGRICPVKGFHLLIEGFKLVRKKIPDAKLLLVGKHSYKYYSEYLRRTGDGSVIFLGYVSDKELPYYYAASDIYVTCSLWEAYNVPVLEARACGKPVIAFDIDAFREVKDDMITLVETGDIKKFAQVCIEKLSRSIVSLA